VRGSVETCFVALDLESVNTQCRDRLSER